MPAKRFKYEIFSYSCIKNISIQVCRQNVRFSLKTDICLFFRPLYVNFDSISIDTEQTAERLCDGFAEYFSYQGALITHVLSFLSHRYGVDRFMIDGQKVDATYLQGATVLLNVTGIALSIGKSHKGQRFNIQIGGNWHNERTILHIAFLLEAISPVKGAIPRSEYLAPLSMRGDGHNLRYTDRL